MEVPCPVPLTEPWSPVGYQIVELPAKDLPGKEPRSKHAPPPATAPLLAEPCPAPVFGSALPRSPVGYRVVCVADEKIPVDYPSRLKQLWEEPARPRTPRRPRPRTSPWAPLAVVGAVLAVVFLPAISMAWLFVSHPEPPRARVVMQVQMPGQMAVNGVPAGPQAVIPEAMRAEPAEPEEPRDPPPPAKVAARPAAGAEERCEQCEAQGAPKKAAPDADSFQTAVHFVRTPQEAARLAKEQDKLTFLLHLSGNFEDPGFT